MERTTRHYLAFIGFVLSVALLQGVGSAQPSVNATGNWNVASSGEAFTSSTLKIDQVGANIVGTYGQTGRIEGTVRAGTLQIDGTWTDSRGTGWMTIFIAEDGNGLSGEWGRPGSRPSGKFTATRVVPVYPVVSGHFSVHATSGREFMSRVVTLNQLGQTVVGNFGPGTQLGGTIAAGGNSLDGTWKGPSGVGWIKLNFASDSKSFQGQWGLVSDTEAQGRIEGSIVNHRQLWVRGRWEIASSGEAFAARELTLQQQGRSVIGTYNGGHLVGTLARGSVVMMGRWRDSRRAGDLVFTFAPDGKSFEGTWTVNGSSGGRIIGRRVIASSPALRR